MKRKRKRCKASSPTIPLYTTIRLNTSLLSIVIILTHLIGCSLGYHLECTSHHMKITYENGVDYKVTQQSTLKFTKEDINCAATQNTTHWVLISGYDDCSMVAVQMQDSISFTNTVVIDPNNNKEGTIVREEHDIVQYVFTCILNRDYSVRSQTGFEIGKYCINVYSFSTLCQCR